MESDNPVTVKFQKLFQQAANSRCLQCGKTSRQWADLAHAIFLCPDCAILFREFSWATKIKSVTWDQWTVDEVERLEKGGNQSFDKFLRVYGLQLANIRTKIASKASSYYRKLLDGAELGQQPSVDEGRMIDKQNIPLADMLPEEMLESAKEKAYWVGGKTKQIGSKGINKVHQKWESGQIKEGAKEMATTVSTKAKELWGFVRGKVGELATSNKVNNNN